MSQHHVSASRDTHQGGAACTAACFDASHTIADAHQLRAGCEMIIECILHPVVHQIGKSPLPPLAEQDLTSLGSHCLMYLA